MVKKAFVIIMAILLGSMIITPYGPAHVISGSMEPEISAGSTIFLVPVANIVTGDVIVFHPAEPGREMIVHRVVGETPEGYLTRGDAVAQTDQEMGEPPVNSDRTAGKALSFNGSVLQVNHNQLIHLALALCLLLGLWAVASTTGTARKKRLRVRHLQQFLLVFCVIIVLFSMIIGSASEAVPFLASENPGTRPDHIKIGEPGILDFKIRNRSPIPSLVFVEGPVNGSRELLSPFSGSQTAITVPACSAPGWHEVSIRKYTYPAVVPPVIIDRLYRLSPYLAMAVVLAAMVLLINFILKVIEPWMPLSLLLGGKSLVRTYRRLKRSFML